MPSILILSKFSLKMLAIGSFKWLYKRAKCHPNGVKMTKSPNLFILFQTYAENFNQDVASQQLYQYLYRYKDQVK